VARLRILSTAQRIAVVIAGVFYIVAGSLHLIKPAPYLRIMPPYIPWHAAIVRVSGAFEILGGMGLLLPATLGGSVGAGGAADRRVSGQYLYGHASGRGGSDGDCAGAEVGTAAVADSADLVAAVVLAASLCAALKEQIELRR
jgi:hypothetical protein